MDIKKVIQSHGWTLEKLASQMTNKNGGKGVSRPTVSQIINGNPTLDKLKEIASIIGIPLSELVSDGEFIALVRRNGETFTFYSENELKSYCKEL